MTNVAITKCNSYSPEEIYKAVKQICGESNFPDIAGKKVLLKPNILSDSEPSNSITTNPEVVRQVIKLCKEKGATEIYVGDSPGMQNPGFKPVKCGIYGVCEEEGATWVDFTKNPVTKTLKNPDTKIPVAAITQEVDVIIGLCKMKTHQLMYTTGAVKNFFGTVPNLNKSQQHLKYQSREEFAKLIVALHETVKPAFSIMDAVVAMEGSGPANGTPRKVGLLIASDNDYAIDVVQATLMDYDPKRIPILAEAYNQNLVPQEVKYPILDPKDLVMADYDRIPYRKKTKFFAKLILPFITRFFGGNRQKKEQRPEFIKEKCIHCLRCVNICPGSALTFDKEQKCIVPDYNKCIRCYCCHEMCPVAAIEVKGK